jgi:DNA polymerase-1
MSNNIGPYVYITSEDEACRVVDEELGWRKIISIDTETTGLDPFLSKMLLVQIAVPNMCYIFDCQYIKLKIFRKLFENEGIIKIIQNAKFDYKMIKAHSGITITNMFDTMSAERLINAGFNAMKSSLAALSEKYVGLTMDKTIRKGFIDTSNSSTLREFSERELEYAANDALVLHMIYDAQVQELSDRGLIETMVLECQTLPVVGDMELSGCQIDKEKWLKVVDIVRERREKAAKELYSVFLPVVKQTNLFGLPVINIDSPAQLLHYLHKMDIRDGSGELVKNTNEDYLSEIHTDNPVIKKLIEYRGWAKMVNTYGLSFLDKIHTKTGRLHTEFDQLRADTGRMSSKDPNLQNIPKYNEKDPGIDLRSCFISKSGYKLVCADYSQQEMRVLADVSGDPTFERAYLNGEDRHKQTAADVFGVKISEVTKEQRFISKTLNFALIYGAGPGRISQMLNIPEEEAKTLLNKYFKTYPKIRGFLDMLANEALVNKYSYTISGRKRYFEFPSLDDPDYRKKIARIKRQASNNFIQGSSADVTKLALVYTNASIFEKKIDAKILMVVHDEIVTEVIESQAELMARTQEECMIKAFYTYFKKIPMIVEAEIADYWCKA